MDVHELKCTGCFAPIKISPGGGPITRCPYCAATLVIEGQAAAATHARSPSVDFSKAVSLTLVNAGECKIDIIKVIREATGLGLKEAKDLVFSAPCVVATRENMAGTKLLELRDALHKAGATTTMANDG
ncbi:MAG: ribosomal protein L7/L12 [Polyangiaceae bacterium]